MDLPGSLFRQLTRGDVIASGLLLFTLGTLARKYQHRSRVESTKLDGPQSKSWIFGVFLEILSTENAASTFEQWTRQFGTAFSLPMALGRRDLVICDVKAVAHVLARDTTIYHQTSFTKVFIENLFGKGILWAEDDDHRRQRKALTPAFSNAAIRGYVSVFYDSAYKVKSAWEALLDNGNTSIEVQSWMNNIALDNLGITGFGHDFGSLDGNKPDVVEIFDGFESPERSTFISRTFFLIGPVLPLLQRLPVRSNRMMKRIKTSMKGVADKLIEQTKTELGVLQDKSMQKSIIGLLIKAENASSGLAMSPEEVLAQSTLLFAGYETTSISLTWALIELCKQPEKQELLRKELSQFQGIDPTWEQLTLGLPYLNAVAQEILRLHPPVAKITRKAMEDDVIPLTIPIRTAAGEMVTELLVAKGSVIHCPISYINQSEDLWGPDAKQFKPERWIGDNLASGAKTIQGYHHVLSFSDGPRLCIGRNFAISNFKATLSVLIRNFAFELPDGPGTKVGQYKGILPRPRIDSEIGPSVPLKIKRVD